MSTEPLITEAKKDELRLKNFEESKFDSSKNKYGLFSFAGTLAILPNSYEKVKRARRNSDGGVITAPRNFQVSPIRTGKQNDSLFSPVSYISLGDKYRDPPRPQLKEKSRVEKMMKAHDQSFKPPGPTDMVTIFEHIATDKPKIKRRRDAEGNVIMEPRNFYTSPAKKGSPNRTPGVTFGETFEHLPEPYDRPKDLKKKERIESHAKMPDRPFRPTGNMPQVLNKDEDVYNIHEEVKKTVKKQSPVKYASHDAPFKPTNPAKLHVMDAVFMKVPEYIPDPLPTITRKSPSPGPMWKSPTKEFSKPSPSISFMKANIRAEFSL